MRALVGYTVTEAVAEIVHAVDDIAAIQCVLVPPSRLVQEEQRLPPETASALKTGLEIRQSYRLPFWDAVLVSCFGRPLPSRDLIGRALHHNTIPAARWRIPAEECNAEELARITTGAVTRDGAVALLSSVIRKTGETGHLPMLDFHCPYSAENQRLATEVLVALDPGPGYLIASGESYHFIGAQLITGSDLTAFLGRALLLSPIIDRAWIAHQLIEGTCALRISAKPGTTEPPRVVALHNKPAVE
ncbi:MAG TPA: hypothetical protein VGW77_04205 [Candidatus Binatia bacterium]|jgi:hypothetical protein|nr:hypothetical protein [Candidatus Binatia bacterium]